MDSEIGRTASLPFRISVVARLAFTASMPDQSYVVGTAIEPLALPEATGGVPPVTYVLGLDVPPGLQFDAGTLTGTPTEARTYPMGYLATDAIGDTALIRFRILVTSAAEPLAFVGSVSDQSYVVGTAIDVLPLPEAYGGTPPLTYEIIGRPKPPPGLKFTYDSGSGTHFLEGTPTEAGEYRMTYKVTDANGEQAELPFTVTVTEPDGAGGDYRISGAMAAEGFQHDRSEESTECSTPSWYAATKKFYPNEYGQYPDDEMVAFQLSVLDACKAGASDPKLCGGLVLFGGCDRGKCGGSCGVLAITSAHGSPKSASVCPRHMVTRHAFSREEGIATLAKAKRAILESSICTENECEIVYEQCAF